MDKKRNPTDATLRNIRALKKKFSNLSLRIVALEKELKSLKPKIK